MNEMCVGRFCESFHAIRFSSRDKSDSPFDLIYRTWNGRWANAWVDSITTQSASNLLKSTQTRGSFNPNPSQCASDFTEPSFQSPKDSIIISFSNFALHAMNYNYKILNDVVMAEQMFAPNGILNFCKMRASNGCRHPPCRRCQFVAVTPILFINLRAHSWVTSLEYDSCAQCGGPGSAHIHTYIHMQCINIQWEQGRRPSSTVHTRDCVSFNSNSKCSANTTSI